MTDLESHPRSPEPITITIIRARNIRGIKSDQTTVSVKIELAEKSIGETPKVECNNEFVAEFNYSTTVNLSFDDPLTIDEFCYRPIILSLTELLPKEKKQKDEKSQELGQCTFDLLPIIRGNSKYQTTLTVHPLPGSPLDNPQSDIPPAEIDVQLSVDKPVFDESQLSDVNIARVTVESLFSPPDSFTPSGPQYGYTAALPLPLTAERDVFAVFPAGSVKPPADKDSPNAKLKKWVAPGSSQGAASYIPQEVISSVPYEEEDGQLKGKEDKDFRIFAESEKYRVTWNMERRCFLHGSAVKSFKDMIAKRRVWPVEIFRIAPPDPKKAAKKEEESGISYHGVAYVNFSPLLYPGVTRIRGAYKVGPYLENEYQEKAHRRHGIHEEAVRVANGIVNRNSASPINRKTADKGQEKKAPEKKSGKTQDGDQEYPANVEGQQYADSQSYIMFEICLDRPLVPKRDAETMAKYVAEYIPQRSMYPKRNNSAEKAVDDYHGQVAEIASRILDEFRELFSEQIKSGEIPSTPEAVEQMRQELMYELNSSGKYFAFKEQLKYSVIKIVREKYLRNTTFASQEELQLFLRDIFVYLVDELQTGLSRVITLSERTPVPPPITTADQLFHFAKEAEVNENHELATRYYQERIARDKNAPQYWFDYGVYCLGQGDVPKAEECFKECIALDQRHIHGLIMYGIVCSLQERHEEAETFLEAATAHDPKNIVAWTILSLFYDSVGNDIGAEMATIEANKLNQAAATEKLRQEMGVKEEGAVADDVVEESSSAAAVDQDATLVDTTAATSNKTFDEGATVPQKSDSRRSSQISENRVADAGSAQAQPKRSVAGQPFTGSGGPKRSTAGAGSRGKINSQTSNVPEESRTQAEPPVEKEIIGIPEKSIYMEAISFLIDMKAFSFVERGLAHELINLTETGPSFEYNLASARLRLLTQEFDAAEKCLMDAVQVDYENSDAWAYLGHLKYLLGEIEAAKDCFERTLAFVNPPRETHSILLRLASIYLQEEKYEEAKNTFLIACKRSPSCISWLGVGIACYRLNELEESEDALSEANILNNRDPEVWGYLSLLCLKTGRKIESEQSYKYALKVGLQDEQLLEEIQLTQQSVGFGDPQF